MEDEDILREFIEDNTLDSIIEALKETYDIDDIIIALTDHGADHEAIAQIQVLVDSVSLDTSGEDI